MVKLPVLKSKDVVKILKRHGFSECRQKGSHLVMADDRGRLITIPMHSKPLKRGTLAAILRHAEISADELR